MNIYILYTHIYVLYTDTSIYTLSENVCTVLSIYIYIPWKSNFVGLQTAILYLVRVHHAPKGTSMFTMVVDIQDLCM